MEKLKNIEEVLDQIDKVIQANTTEGLDHLNSSLASGKYRIIFKENTLFF